MKYHISGEYGGLSKTIILDFQLLAPSVKLLMHIVSQHPVTRFSYYFL
jgi:hypothetical protein